MLGAYFVGETHDTGATTTAAVYESLGRPDYIAPHFTGGRTVYRYVVPSTLTYNLSVAYRFREGGSDLTNGLRVRVGIVNLTDKEPPLATGGFGYDPAVYQNLVPGRTWTLEVSKRF